MTTEAHSALILARKYRKAMEALNDIANCDYSDLAKYCRKVDGLAYIALTTIEVMV